MINSDKILLGNLCSSSGGLKNVFKEAKQLGVNVFQIYTKSPRQWKEKEFSVADEILFKKGLIEENIECAFSHSSYLINLLFNTGVLLNRVYESFDSGRNQLREVDLTESVFIRAGLSFGL